MSLSSLLLDELHSDDARRKQQRYNSRRQRKKRQKAKAAKDKRQELVRLYRQYLPGFLAKAFELNPEQICEVRPLRSDLSRIYDLMYLVDDIVIGIKFRSTTRWVIKKFTGFSADGYVIYCGKYNGFAIMQSKLSGFTREDLKIALAKIERSRVIDQQFRFTPSFREQLGIELVQTPPQL